MAGILAIAAASAAAAGATSWWRQRQNKRLQTQLSTFEAEKDALSAELTQTQSRLDAAVASGTGVLVLDRLEVIAGITPHHARLLNAAGVLTYNDLAQLSAEKVTLLTAAAGGARMDVNRWIEQAEALAAQSAALPAWHIA